MKALKFVLAMSFLFSVSSAFGSNMPNNRECSATKHKAVKRVASLTKGTAKKVRKNSSKSSNGRG